MTDFFMLERFYNMMHASFKPRWMFRKGISVRGFFRPYHSFADYTKALMFQDAEQITPVCVRFCAMLGDKGTADTVRNIKGMHVKFTPEDGVYDMICQSIPVTFINDKDKIFDLYEVFFGKHSLTGKHQAEFWDYVVRNPETANCAIRFYSHEGLSDSFVDVKWYSVNLMIWENAYGEKFLVRYQWVPILDTGAGIRNENKRLSKNEAEFIAGFDPDRAVNDLVNRILSGIFPAYELRVQMMEYNIKARTSCMKPTLLWNEKHYPVRAAGIMNLSRFSEDSMEECDRLSFAPGNTVNGIALYRDAFSDVMDHMCRIEAIERGVTL